MRHRTTIGISALLLLIGCAHERRQAPPPAPPAAPQPGAQRAPQQPSSTPPPSAPLPAATAGTEAGTRTTEAARAAATPAAPSSRGSSAGSAGATASANAKAKAPSRAESAAAGAPRTAAPAGAASAGAAAAGTAEARPTPPSAPTLDLPSLEQRLKDTRAIGLFTKLSLKNQVDDLLGEFRIFHSGNHTLTVAALRQKYDLLLLKVLSLLQDGDPPLAAAISTSREAIWEILIDPQKFEKLASN
ncbi:MAG TPA: hypothetical protein VH111_02965 [Steroidobacteraceae bacterium]|nr:hypothetical protein [Steroidobacteraceae bacterium]